MNELITKVSRRNVKSILTNVFQSSSDTSSTQVFHVFVTGTEPLLSATVDGLTALSVNHIYLLEMESSINGGCDLDINSLGAKTLANADSSVIATGDLVAGQTYAAIYNLSNDRFNLLF